MDDNQKKYAVDDDSLDQVAGGVINPDSDDKYDQWKCVGPNGCGAIFLCIKGKTPPICTFCRNKEVSKV